MSVYYDRKGKPMGMLAWAKAFEDPKIKIVKRDTLPNGKLVSTVWLGLDHNFMGDRPLIFETMVFPKEGDYSELEMDRYSTEQEAIEGHKRMVEKHKGQS